MTAESMLSLQNLMEAARPSAFIMGNPPLAALHSMTEKTPAFPYPAQPFATAPGTFRPVAMCMTSTPSSISPTTPHGINDILNRQGEAVAGQFSNLQPGTPGFLSAGLGGMAARFGAFNTSMYLSRLGKPLTDLPATSPAAHLYWPASLFQSTPSWRDARFPCGAAYGGQQSIAVIDKDGKKKHTRPTFSGQQIFALEKTFEQTKYLAGPERARLAYALGMTESQVKVWFQNRRTKWRKKHAAEMATAKRKHDSSDNDHLSIDASSDTEDVIEHERRRHDSDGESMAKRRREEDYGKDSLVSNSSS